MALHCSRVVGGLHASTSSVATGAARAPLLRRQTWLIVDESIWGVINAGLIVALANDAPIALVAGGFALAPWLGVIGFVGAIVWLYAWMLRRSRVAR